MTWPRRGPSGISQTVEPVAFDFEDDDSMRAALAGVDKVCLISPGLKGYHTEEVKRFVGFAAQAGVGHIVRISIVWADDPAVTFGRWHAEIERALQASGMTWTVLRPQPLMDNFVVYTPPDQDGMIYMPVGNGRDRIHLSERCGSRRCIGPDVGERSRRRDASALRPGRVGDCGCR